MSYVRRKMKNITSIRKKKALHFCTQALNPHIFSAQETSLNSRTHISVMNQIFYFDTLDALNTLHMNQILWWESYNYPTSSHRSIGYATTKLSPLQKFHIGDASRNRNRSWREKLKQIKQCSSMLPFKIYMQECSLTKQQHGQEKNTVVWKRYKMSTTERSSQQLCLRRKMFITSSSFSDC